MNSNLLVQEQKFCGVTTKLFATFCYSDIPISLNFDQGQGLARSITEKLGELNKVVSRAVNNVERSGIQQPAHTVAGRLEQAHRWLNNPSVDDKGLGQQAIGLIVEEGRKVRSVS